MQRGVLFHGGKNNVEALWSRNKNTQIKIKKKSFIQQVHKHIPIFLSLWCKCEIDLHNLNINLT